MKKILLFVLLLVLKISLLGQYDRPGSSTAQFLKIGVSPKAAAMGNAYVSAVQGPEAVYYNPSVIATAEGTGMIFSHNEWFADVNHDFLAITHNFNRIGAFGLSIVSYSTNPMKVRTPVQPEGTGETFYLSHYSLGFTYARRLTDHVTFGGTVKYIDLSLTRKFKQQAFATDIAALYDTDFRNFRFGMKIGNFGSSVTYVNEQYPLPLTFSFGMSINAIETREHALLISAEALKPNDGETLTTTGLEWNYSNILFLRSGYQINHDIGTFTFGGGLQLSLAGYKGDFDYSYSGYGDLGAAHRFSVSLYIK